ncbi:MAG: hypothetical protein ABJ205_10660 [Erythrobacter sp.]|uniref:hypothetical protein n=1 Tax=Erythrobacter sp. TaxID=1042 RepID=UPI0032648DDF
MDEAQERAIIEDSIETVERTTGQPTQIKVTKGSLTAIPYSLEVNDHFGFFIYNMSPREYAESLIRQFDRLAD